MGNFGNISGIIDAEKEQEQLIEKYLTHSYLALKESERQLKICDEMAVKAINLHFGKNKLSDDKLITFVEMAFKVYNKCTYPHVHTGQ